MKHIILYENFGSEIFEQEKTLSSGAILRSNEGGSLKAGQIYASFSESETAPSMEISYMKDGQTKVGLTFAGGEGIGIKSDGNKDIVAKCYASFRKYEGEGSESNKGFATMSEATTSAVLDAFFGYAGSYADTAKGKVLADKLVKTLFELKKSPEYKDIEPLIQITLFMSNMAKLNKPIIAGTIEGQKEINAALIAAVKAELKG